MVHCVHVDRRSSARTLGVEALLASRSLGGSLAQNLRAGGALATAVAMMTSVGIMVGSFRQTVLTWMETELPADLYLRPAGDGRRPAPHHGARGCGADRGIPGVESVSGCAPTRLSTRACPPRWPAQSRTRAAAPEPDVSFRTARC